VTEGLFINQLLIISKSLRHLLFGDSSLKLPLKLLSDTGFIRLKIFPRPWALAPRHWTYLTHCSRLATLTKVMDVRKTDFYIKWIDSLRDINARARIFEPCA